MCEPRKYFANTEEMNKVRTILVELQKRREAKIRTGFKTVNLNIVEEFDEAFGADAEEMRARFGWALVDYNGEIINNAVEHHHSFSSNQPSSYLQAEMRRLNAAGIRCRITRVSIHERSVIDRLVAKEMELKVLKARYGC